MGFTDGNFIDISADRSEVWAVTESKSVYLRSGITSDNPGGSLWIPGLCVSHSLKMKIKGGKRECLVEKTKLMSKDNQQFGSSEEVCRSWKVKIKKTCFKSFSYTSSL